MLYQNDTDLICSQSIVERKNIKAQDGSLGCHNNLIGILSTQLAKYSIYGKFYEPNLMNNCSLVLELKSANQDIFESAPKQELALPDTPGHAVFVSLASVSSSEISFKVQIFG